MKSLKTFLISLLTCLFIISCQKEHITTTNTTVGSPVFYFNGTVGGNNISLQAGKNNYYMYSSYSQNSAGVYSFIGNLKEFGCTGGCGGSSIEFIINDYIALPAGSSEKNISDSSLAIGYYGYSSPSSTPTKFGVVFNSSIGQGSKPISYTYDFGDGATQTIAGAPPASFNHIYYTQGNFNTSLSVTFPGNHITSLSDSLKLGTPTKAITATLSYTDSATVIYKVVINGGTKPYNIVWNFGDTAGTNTSTHPSVNSTIDTASHVYISQGMHMASVIIKDSHNISVIANTNIVPLGGNNTYAMNYSISAPVPVNNSLGLSNVTIIYTDPTSDVYTTADSNQNIGSNFQVVSVAPYNNNENNQTTKQLHIKFNCTLYDNKGKSLTITNGDAVIAVAYK